MTEVGSHLGFSVNPFIFRKFFVVVVVVVVVLPLEELYSSVEALQKVNQRTDLSSPPKTTVQS